MITANALSPNYLVLFIEWTLCCVLVSVVETTTRREIFVRNQYVACPSGYSLLSCGIDNSQTTQGEKYRAAHPYSSSKCHCYDYYGATCVVHCARTVTGFAYPTTGVTTGTLSVDCPSGTLVNMVQLAAITLTSIRMMFKTCSNTDGHPLPNCLPKVYVVTFCFLKVK